MDIFGVIALFGGLALFLFGMEVMGDGLTKTAGGKLEILLEKLSSTTFRGMLLGTAVTAVIQSSSATTVMVVGFVNSGIMKLSQATGVILGANLGTTVTAWILSLTDISGESFFLRILKPSTFSPIMGMIGIILYAFTKSERNKNVGSILLGFAVLMTGMDVMSSAVDPLVEMPEFRNLMIMFQNPLLGMLVGLIVTAVIQSSSASIGILQALSLSGSVSFATAIPIILGQNIGTCVTALISSAGAKTNAKRAAFIHLYFNIFKVVVFLVIFYTINMVHPFAFMDDFISPVWIAIMHTALNICAIAIFLPLSKVLEKAAMLTIKDKPKSDEEQEIDKYEKQLLFLDERFIELAPMVAVEQCMAVTRKMIELTAKSITESILYMFDQNRKSFDKVSRLETVVDVYEDRLGTYIVQLSQRTLSISDSNRLSIILHCISNFERISDHAINIAEVTKRMQEKHETFSESCLRELRIYCDAIEEIVHNTKEVFVHSDLELAKRIEPLEEVIDNINEKAKRHHIKRLKNGECTVELGIHFDNIINDLERISDHCSNVAICLIEINENVYETHEYMDVLKNTQSPNFLALYNEYDNKYHL